MHEARLGPPPSAPTADRCAPPTRTASTRSSCCAATPGTDGSTLMSSKPASASCSQPTTFTSSTLRSPTSRRLSHLPGGVIGRLRPRGSRRSRWRSAFALLAALAGAWALVWLACPLMIVLGRSATCGGPACDEVRVQGAGTTRTALLYVARRGDARGSSKIDYRRELREFYSAGPEPTVVEVPEMAFLMIDGHGDLNTVPENGQAVEASPSSTRQPTTDLRAPPIPTPRHPFTLPSPRIHPGFARQTPKRGSACRAEECRPGVRPTTRRLGTCPRTSARCRRGGRSRRRTRACRPMGAASARCANPSRRRPGTHHCRAVLPQQCLLGVGKAIGGKGAVTGDAWHQAPGVVGEPNRREAARRQAAMAVLRVMNATQARFRLRRDTRHRCHRGPRP